MVRKTYRQIVKEEWIKYTEKIPKKDQKLSKINYTLASGSADNTIKLWDLNDKKCTHTLEGHTRSVWCLQLIDK
ncbi:unnamed protein product [Brachionus calyciflorus]|uniref:Uncharacterized protein n=1 Tax=Brachionus calyciflorus TaxID=104777 RepID=A0A814L2A7_9BILA|nr:unnamed protein product [Brachionus calyciflorus]